MATSAFSGTDAWGSISSCLLGCDTSNEDISPDLLLSSRCRAKNFLVLLRGPLALDLAMQLRSYLPLKRHLQKLYHV